MGNLKGLTQKLFNKLTALVRIICVMLNSLGFKLGS